MPQFLATERRDGGVELIRLTRPPLNALSAELLAELADHAETLVTDAELKAVVVTGTEKAFSVGAEVTQLRGEGPDLLGNFRRALDAVAAIPRPVIAAVSGYALGGGLETALACDLRLASESARLGVPEILLGVFPGGGATQRLPRLVGPAKAKEMIWSGRQVRAAEALAMGLVNRVAPDGRALPAALGLAQELAALPQAALRNDRLSAIEQWDLPEPEAVANEFRRGMATLASGETAAGAAGFAAGQGRHGRPVPRNPGAETQ